MNRDNLGKEELVNLLKKQDSLIENFHKKDELFFALVSILNEQHSLSEAIIILSCFSKNLDSHIEKVYYIDTENNNSKKEMLIINLFNNFHENILVKNINKSTYEVLKEYNIKSCLYIPYYIDDKLIGILAHENYIHFYNFDKSHIIYKISNILFFLIKKELLEKASKELYEKNESYNKIYNSFLSNLSHEIRTPINAIIGKTLIAQSIPTEVNQALIDIKKASNKLFDLVNDLLDVSKINANLLVLHKEYFSIEDLFNDIYKNNIFLFDDKNQILSIYVDKKIPKRINGDAYRLSQIITNLISNANKFTSEGGKITLCVDLMSIDEAYCEVKFSVKDNGIGMMTEQIKNIFMPFSQVDMSKKKRHAGLGLGLSISKNLIEMMGGEISVKSELGKGTMFSFQLRVEYDNNIVETALNDEIDYSKCNILIVDDIEINREIVKLMLSDLNASITEATNGFEAVNFVSSAKDKFDLILMDIQMPLMDGYEATRQILNINKNITIIALSANALKDDVIKTLESGMKNHIAKPVDIDELISKVKQNLNMKYV